MHRSGLKHKWFAHCVICGKFQIRLNKGYKRYGQRFFYCDNCHFGRK